MKNLGVFYTLDINTFCLVFISFLPHCAVEMVLIDESLWNEKLGSVTKKKTHTVTLEDSETWKEFTVKISKSYPASQKGPEINLY